MERSRRTARQESKETIAARFGLCTAIRCENVARAFKSYRRLVEKAFHAFRGRAWLGTASDSVHAARMAYTITIFPEGGGAIRHELKASDDAAAIAEATGVAAQRPGHRLPFVVRENNLAFYSWGDLPTGISMEWRAAK